MNLLKTLINAYLAKCIAQILFLIVTSATLGYYLHMIEITHPTAIADFVGILGALCNAFFLICLWQFFVIRKLKNKFTRHPLGYLLDKNNLAYCPNHGLDNAPLMNENFSFERYVNEYQCPMCNKFFTFQPKLNPTENQ